MMLFSAQEMKAIQWSIIIRLHFQRGWWDSYFTITVILKHKSQTRSVDSHCCSSSSSPLCWIRWRATQDSSYVAIQTHWGMKGSREWVMYDDTAKCGSVGAKGGLKPGKRIWTLKIKCLNLLISTGSKIGIFLITVTYVLWCHILAHQKIKLCHPSALFLK